MPRCAGRVEVGGGEVGECGEEEGVDTDGAVWWEGDLEAAAVSFALSGDAGAGVAFKVKVS